VRAPVPIERVSRREVSSCVPSDEACGSRESGRANGSNLQWNVARALGNTVEIERSYRISGHPGASRLLGYRNQSDAGSYRAALELGTQPSPWRL